MQIPAGEIKYKKKIGHIGDAAVWEVGTKGGFHVVLSQKADRLETLGVGPHRAVARHLAKRNAPGMVITELSKSEHIEEEFLVGPIMDKYQKLTDMLRKKEK